MALAAPTPLDRPATSLEPPLGLLAAVAAGLFVAGLVLSTVLAGGSPFPSPFGAADDALAAAFLICSGVVSWVLTVPEVVADPALVRALHTLAFLCGGPGNVVTTGLLIAGIALSALLQRRLAPWLPVAGLVIALIALGTTAALTVTAAAFLLPIARFTGMAWLIAVGFLLPRS
ncbi:hypothetical protein ACQPW1_07070 [Nocardia sp. CA-128927]|uniref:hypothetical protein n=1 Tax=Nocardia sp. CA-128927 TaxID=3239975 RepID=UPI003D978339